MNAHRHTYEHYWDKGWVVVENVFEPDDVDRVAALALELGRRQDSDGRPGYLMDSSPDGAEVAPRKMDGAYLKDPLFRQFLSHRRLHELLRTLLGAEALLVSDQIFFKPPRHGSAKPYHQDNFYFRCHPDDAFITAWIALDDVDVHNGCLRYIDGSHRGPILPHHVLPGEAYNSVPPAELIDLSRESLAPVRKGGVVFHHSKTLHTSRRNESERWRRGFASHWVTPGVTCETGELDKAYFKRDDYRAFLRGSMS